MRRYTLSVSDTTKVVDVESVGPDTYRVQIDGRLVEVRLDDHRDLAHSAVTPAVTARPAALRGDADGAPAAPARAVEAPPAEVAGAAAPARAASAPVGPAAVPAGSGGGRDKLTAPMPGVILTIDAPVGTAVRRGDTVMVLEAMKMKNELKAPRDGTVAEVYVAAGQQVKYGETLVRFEA